ncbi:MAG: TolC family protein [Bacteroidales bacterium]|nr:TolC family protein [Bacteroidales bacterium]
MNLRLYILLIIPLNLASLYGQADTFCTLSLKEAQEYALQHNRSIRISELDLEIARKKIRETIATGLPRFSADINYQHILKVPVFSFPITGFTQNPLTDVPEGFEQFQDPELTGGLNQYIYNQPGFPVAEKDNATYDFTLSQLVFSGEYIVGLQASRVFKELSEQALTKTENDIRESVSNSYNAVLVLARSLEITRESYLVVSKAQYEMDQLYRQGFASETDADRLVILKNQLENAINTLEGQERISKKILLMQLGLDISINCILTDSIPGLLYDTDLKLLTSAVFNADRNINYQLATTATKLEKLNLKRQKSKFFPTVSAFYRHQELAREPVLNFQPKDVLGVAVSFPIFNSGQRLSLVSQARIEYEKSKLAQTDAEQGLLIRFETAKNDYVTAYENYITSENNFNLSRKIFNKSIVSFQEGVTSSLELTSDQREFLTAESDYINSIMKLLTAKAELDNLLSQN